MPDGFSLIKIDGKLVEPATVLIKKIADAIGGGFKPRQIRRVAEAEADAEIIRAKAEIQITDLQQRALTRFVVEESKKQDNIESITEKAIGQLSPSSTPQDIEDDWITNFFDKCRIISDEDMQLLWAKILAGESNAPGTYSKRIINALGSLDKAEAELFMLLCSFTILIDEDMVPIIFYDGSRKANSIYSNKGLTFNILNHLWSIGLISFEATGYRHYTLKQQFQISYHNTNLKLEFIEPLSNVEDYKISIGNVLLTRVGQQLAGICSSEEVDGFFDYVVKKFTEDKTVIISQ